MQYNSSDIGDSEKIFNLQLAVSKLQEEVNLYRNGVDVPQLLELIREKDIEIENLKETITLVEDKNFSLLQLRAELVSKHENLMDEMQTVRMENFEAINNLNSIKEELLTKENDIRMIEHSQKQLELKLKQKEEHLVSMENNTRVLDGQVFELQSRCAKIVREKTELLKSFDRERAEKSKQISEYRLQIDKSIFYNNEIKEKLDHEHTKGLELANSLKLKQKELLLLQEEFSKASLILEDQKKIIHSLEEEKIKILSTLPHHLVSVDDNLLMESVKIDNLDEALKRINELEGLINHREQNDKARVLRDKTNTNSASTIEIVDKMDKLNSIKVMSFDDKSSRLSAAREKQRRRSFTRRNKGQIETEIRPDPVTDYCL